MNAIHEPTEEKYEWKPEMQEMSEELKEEVTIKNEKRSTQRNSSILADCFKE